MYYFLSIVGGVLMINMVLKVLDWTESNNLIKSTIRWAFKALVYFLFVIIDLVGAYLLLLGLISLVGANMIIMTLLIIITILLLLPVIVKLLNKYKVSYKT